MSEQTKANDLLLESYRPIYHGLDWRLRAAYWDLRGGQAFLSGEVPSLMTNDGVLASKVGDVLYAHCLELEAQGHREETIRVVELGAGLGLHGRLVLDHFKACCLEDGRDFHTRLEVYITDMSRDMLADIDSRGTFEGWESQIHLGQLDATTPSVFTAWPDGTRHTLRPIHMMWCNYVMCVLPFSMLRPSEQGWSELQAQTWLVNHADQPPLTHDAILPLLNQVDTDAAPLLAMRHRLAVEWSWQQVDDVPDTTAAFFRDVVEPAWPDTSETEPFVLASWGALESLEAMLTNVMSPNGVVLFGDYGWSTSEALSSIDPSYQHFGASAAMGLNFPWLASMLGTHAHITLPNPGEGPLFVCCVSQEALPQTHAAVHHAFGPGERSLEHYSARLQAVEHAYTRQDGELAARLAEAMNTDFPGSWLLLCVWSSIETKLQRNSDKGLELGLKALALNATSSARPWLQVGDALYSLGRVDDAHAAYLRAYTINPEDAEAHNCLMWTFFYKGDYTKALESACQTLIYDRDQEYRASVFRKMNEILDARAQTVAFEDETGVG